MVQGLFPAERLTGHDGEIWQILLKNYCQLRELLQDLQVWSARQLVKSIRRRSLLSSNYYSAEGGGAPGVHDLRIDGSLPPDFQIGTLF